MKTYLLLKYYTLLVKYHDYRTMCCYIDQRRARTRELRHRAKATLAHYYVRTL